MWEETEENLETRGKVREEGGEEGVNVYVSLRFAFFLKSVPVCPYVYHCVFLFHVSPLIPPTLFSLLFLTAMLFPRVGLLLGIQRGSGSYTEVVSLHTHINISVCLECR